MMIRILMADDHAIVRAGLKQIVSDEPDMVVAGEADSGPTVLDMARKADWDVVLLDIKMPGRGGLDILKQLHDERPRLPVLILSIYPEEQFAVRCLKAGASGYLTKESAPDELVAAIRKVTEGGIYITRSFAEKLALALQTVPGQLPHEILSDREHQVMLLIASGKTVSKIAEQLSLSPKTIHTYRSRILEKMRMKTNAEIMHYAIKHGLVE
jgi:two-component system invasion response regulator UvrY